MKLTVANRIIGGFGIILILLSAIGAKAYFSFSNVEQETVQAKDISIPTLQLSNALQNQLMIIQRLSLFEYYASDVANLDTLSQDLSAANDEFNAKLQQLKTVSTSNPQLLGQVESIQSSINTTLQSTTALYQSKRRSLELQTSLQSHLNDFTDAADDFSSLMLDISDLTSDEDTAKLDIIIGMAGDLDNAILSMMKTNEDITKQPTIIKTEAVSKELNFIVNDIKNRLEFMLSRADDLLEPEFVEELHDKNQQVSIYTIGSQSISAIKIDSLREINRTEELSNTSRENITKTNALVTKLLANASQQASDSQQQVLEQVTTGKTQVSILMLIAIIFGVIIAIKTIKSITFPLNRINKLLTVLASGDLTQSVNLDSKDEFGTLAKNINHLATSLKTLIASIAQGSAQLATASEQTSAITTQTTGAIAEQRLQVDQAASATVELNSSAQHVAEHATTTLEEIARTSAQALDIAKISNDSKDTISSLSLEISSASEVINKLHEDSNNIGSIIDVIRGIAEQTNLLALNAAIEAARAGEQGRGFAVVADEVRNLANRTQQSTQEINNMIELIQSGAVAAVKVMDASQMRAQTCVSESEKATQELTAMTHSLEQVHENSNQISNAANEQNLVSQEISKLLETIVQIAQETSQGAEETAQASNEVASLADGLQQSAAQFKV